MDYLRKTVTKEQNVNRVFVRKRNLVGLVVEKSDE